MNERIEALRGRLPDDVLSKVRMYDCHPTATLMKEVKLKAWGESGPIAAGTQVSVQPPTYFNRSESRYVDKDLTELRFYFPRWRFQTVEHLIYIPDWAEEEYLEEKLASWLDR